MTPQNCTNSAVSHAGCAYKKAQEDENYSLSYVTGYFVYFRGSAVAVATPARLIRPI